MGQRNCLATTAIVAAVLCAGPAAAQTIVTIGIGTQDTTTNTVTTGTIVRELKLLEKHLPKDGKYANIKFELEWQNFTSGPPVTNAIKPPPSEMSQAAMPLGPQAAQERSASSVSVKARGALLETNSIGPFSWGISRPVTGCFSVVPESIR